tara:strand:- start:6365 stop:6601 length:237 start_codon:yes stop_codon:yes gene_type:complete
MPVIKGEKKFVVGLDIPYEEQKNADLILESDQYSPEVLLGLLWDNIKDKLYDNRLTDSLFPQNSNQPLSQNTLAQIKN